jgi:hypothetical protein
VPEAPPCLGTVIPAGSKVGVVGSSHSAILVLKNLYELGNVSVANFSCSPLIYAIYKDDWILYDNTGLKRDRGRLGESSTGDG